ncbi:MAG TPA: hypothetical protein VNX68_05125 [Nitrosopumilaceae archaeon]|jgi:hypothetical protein|nr:hypothetical protein [Nitrosopumilaceae archaeon]
MDDLDKEIFICMYCQKKFSVLEGTWPQDDADGEPMINSDLNDRSREEFACYGCV